MHSHHRGRGKILFEVLCVLSLAASFAGAWDQTGSSALLASASIMALFALYWSLGLFARRRSEPAVQSIAAVAEPPEAAVVSAVPEEVFARDPEAETAVRVEVLPFQPDLPPEPEPVAPAPKKKRARKAKKVAADVAAVVEQPEPASLGEPVAHERPPEPLFEH